MAKKKTHHLDCGECKAEKTILYTVKDDSEHVTVLIHKCTSCKYQYGIKELFNLHGDGK